MLQNSGECIKALEIKHQHVLIQTWRRIKYIAARSAKPAFAAVHIGRHNPMSMEPRKIKDIEGGHRSPLLINITAREIGALNSKSNEICLDEDLVDQRAIAHVVVGQHGLVVAKLAVDFCRLVLFGRDQLALTKRW